MSEKKREKKKKYSKTFRIILPILLTILIIEITSMAYSIGYINGRYQGLLTASKEFVETFTFLIKYADVKITANLSLNQTKLVEDIFSNLNKSALTQPVPTLSNYRVVNESKNPKGETSLLLHGPECPGGTCKNLQVNKSMLENYYDGNWDTYHTIYQNYSKPNDEVCYTVPSPPKCNYIEFTNGTKIIKECFQTYNYILQCFNKSDIKNYENST
jgi:hypothetical protein